MNTPNPEIQMPVAGRRRGLYSLEFKHQVVAACLEPAVVRADAELTQGQNVVGANSAVAQRLEVAKIFDGTRPRNLTRPAAIHSYLGLLGTISCEVVDSALVRGPLNPPAMHRQRTSLHPLHHLFGAATSPKHLSAVQI